MRNTALVGSISFRLYFYLKMCKIHNIKLHRVLIYDYKSLDISKFQNELISYENYTVVIDEPLEKLLSFFSAEYYDKQTINHLEEELKKVKVDFFIFCGRGGEIVQRNILSTNRFLHIHSGKLPKYRGSTTVYYSILEEQKCYASAIFLDLAIDTGEMIGEKEFHLINCDFDYVYDPFIRSILLIEVLKQEKIISQKQVSTDAKTYYIIHPVLKKLALNMKQRCVK